MKKCNTEIASKDKRDGRGRVPAEIGSPVHFEEVELHIRSENGGLFRPVWSSDRDVVHLISADSDTLLFDTASFTDIFTPDEIERAGRFRFDRDKKLFLTARGLLRVFIGHYTGIRPHLVSFSAGPFGKPILDVASSSHQSIDFNVSHSGSRVLIGLAHTDIGVDVEKIELDRNYDAIAKRYFSKAERESLSLLDGKNKTIGFYNAWSRKEAFLKALGIGLSEHLDAFDVELRPSQPAAILDIRPNRAEWEDEQPENWHVVNFPSDPDYAYSAFIRKDSKGNAPHIHAWSISRLVII